MREALGATFICMHPIPCGALQGSVLQQVCPVRATGAEVHLELPPCSSQGLACSPADRLGTYGGAKCLVLTPDKRGDADRHERNIPSN